MAATSAAATALVVAIPFSAARAQQVPDTTFDARVARPAYAAEGPRLWIDQAHHNFHTASGRYRAFAELARNDGYRVTPSAQPFTAARLKAPVRSRWA